MTEELIEYAKVKFADEEAEAELPEQIGYLWHWFCDLTDWRAVGWGINALSHQEIEAWARLYRVDISPFEVDVLRKLDRTFRLHMHDVNNPPSVPIGQQLRELAEHNGR